MALPALLLCLWTGALPRQEMGQAALQITLVLLLAYLVWELARLAIDRRLHAEYPGMQAMGDDAGQGASRLATLLPPLRVTLQAAVLTIAILSVLSALSIDIRPLLAGAGVVGLALGFGAQTLVRDVISGMFFLLDDAFRRGEYIDVGAVQGNRGADLDPLVTPCATIAARCTRSRSARSTTSPTTAATGRS